MNKIMYKIGICGAHGTGKSTLVELISELYSIPKLQRTLRNYWESIGVINFELLPKDIRTVCQNYIFTNFLNAEDAQDSFVSDRSVVDYLAHTMLDTDMPENQLEIFKFLVKERLKNYTHLFYLPIEFEVENEVLRADIHKRTQIDTLIISILEKHYQDKYFVISGSVEERLEKIKTILGNKI